MSPFSIRNAFLSSLMLVGINNAAAAAGKLTSNQEFESPEMIFRKTVSKWRTLLLSSSSSPNESKNDWLPWHDFSQTIQGQFFSMQNDQQQQPNFSRLDIVGAMEEGILTIERSSVEREQRYNRQLPPQQQKQEEAALSLLYTTYGNLLMNLTPDECLGLALDPHTLLIGAERVKKDPKQQVPDTFLCTENAENALRNALTLDATNQHAEELFQKLTTDNDGTNTSSSVHERKPKEFVAELFDSFADTFDEKLLGNLEYRVPEMVGKLAKQLVSRHTKRQYRAVLDAGCGTGLAGRYIRPIMERSTGTPTNVVLVGVDASQKMLDKAALCTMDSGCGLEVKTKDDKNDSGDSRLLYDALLNMDLEDMNLENSLYITRGGKKNSNDKNVPEAFDLIVAADVLVYFGSLEKLIDTFAKISTEGSHLIFSCELAKPDEAPLGWRLLPSGRFAHTKEHAVDIAQKAGYDLIHYEEIVPRTEKGEPVRGHLFGFEQRKASIEGEL